MATAHADQFYQPSADEIAADYARSPVGKIIEGMFARLPVDRRAERSAFDMADAALLAAVGPARFDDLADAPPVAAFAEPTRGLRLARMAEEIALNDRPSWRRDGRVLDGFADGFGFVLEAACRAGIDSPWLNKSPTTITGAIRWLAGWCERTDRAQVAPGDVILYGLQWGREVEPHVAIVCPGGHFIAHAYPCTPACRSYLTGTSSWLGGPVHGRPGWRTDVLGIWSVGEGA